MQDHRDGEEHDGEGDRHSGEVGHFEIGRIDCRFGIEVGKPDRAAGDEERVQNQIERGVIAEVERNDAGSDAKTDHVAETV